MVANFQKNQQRLLLKSNEVYLRQGKIKQLQPQAETSSFLLKKKVSLRHPAIPRKTITNKTFVFTRFFVWLSVNLFNKCRTFWLPAPAVADEYTNSWHSRNRPRHEILNDLGGGSSAHALRGSSAHALGLMTH